METTDDMVAIAGFGVDLFFVISGFLMVYTTANLTGTIPECIQFMKRRLIRIVPLYWAVTSVMLVLLVLFPSAFRHLTLDPMHAITSYLFIPYTNPMGEQQPLVAVGWTLSYEMYFYIFFALALALSRRWLLWIITGYFALSVLAGIDGIAQGFLTNPRLLDFVLGCWVARAVLANYGFAKWMSFLLLAACVTIIFLYPQELNVYRAGLLSAALVWLMMSLEMQQHWVVPHWLAILGNGTFALYLIHNFMFTVLYRFWQAQPHLFIPVAFLFTVMVAQGIYTYVEAPVTRWLKRRYAP